MGYATVVACSRAILEIGNEAEVDSGYIWITADNMEDPEVAAMLY
jgi:ribose transport system substrate-binding protein